MELQSLATYVCVTTAAGLGIGHYLIERCTAEPLSSRAFFADLFSPNGTLSRARYWFASWLVYGVHAYLLATALAHGGPPLRQSALAIATLLWLYPTWIVATKRLRDMGRSPAWAGSLILLPLLPLTVAALGLPPTSHSAHRRPSMV
ncbi:MAG: DUF805 domain-containing protein [Pseudomonadota bacterium]